MTAVFASEVITHSLHFLLYAGLLIYSFIFIQHVELQYDVSDLNKAIFYLYIENDAILKTEDCPTCKMTCIQLPKAQCLFTNLKCYQCVVESVYFGIDIKATEFSFISPYLLQNNENSFRNWNLMSPKTHYWLHIDSHVFNGESRLTFEISYLGPNGDDLGLQGYLRTKYDTKLDEVQDIKEVIYFTVLCCIMIFELVTIVWGMCQNRRKQLSKEKEAVLKKFDEDSNLVQ